MVVHGPYKRLIFHNIWGRGVVVGGKVKLATQGPSGRRALEKPECLFLFAIFFILSN